MSETFAKDAFFAKLEQQELSITFDDVRLKTQHSNVMPSQADTSTQFSRRVRLEIPLVSAAMDTITEYPMARVLAELGGIGVIHRGLDPVEQARQVARTKHYLNAKIEKPICVKPTQTIGEVLRMREDRDFAFHSFPVIDNDGRLIGIITKNDFDFYEENSNTLVADAMTKTPVSIQGNLTAREAYTFMQTHKKKVLPLTDKNGMITGMYVYSDLRRILRSGNHLRQNTDINGQLRVAAAIGVEDYDRAEKLRDANVDVLVLQSAHCDTNSMINTLQYLKKNPAFNDIDIVIGNVSEPYSALRMADAGADGILVGQGGGSICTTRIVAGIGCPQVTAIDQCERALRNHQIPICSDGGIVNSGDIVVALGAGAKSCMVGNLLAGTDETPGDVFYQQGHPYKSYAGMGSISRLRSSKASRERYNLIDTGKSELIPEGVEARVPYKGPVATIINQAIGGIRSGMGSAGAKTIDELRRTAQFHRITSAGLRESHPHNIDIAVEAPNYWSKR